PQWLHNDHVVVLEADIARITSIHQEIVHIRLPYQLVVPINLDVSEASALVRPSCSIQGVKDRSKRRKIVGPWLSQFSSHGYVDGSDVAETHLDKGIGVISLKAGIDLA